jgi:hypothetical protein
MNRRSFLAGLAGQSLLQAAPKRSGSESSAASVVTAGDLRAVEWSLTNSRLFLYADLPAPESEFPLYADDLAVLGRACFSDYAFSLEPAPSGNILEIRYLPLIPTGMDISTDDRRKLQSEIHRILRDTTVENSLLMCDEFLKQAAAGRDLPRLVRLGPSELTLCSREIATHIRSGKTLDQYARVPYVSFFTFAVAVAKGDFAEGGFWIRSAGVRVNAQRKDYTPAPACVEDFAATLTANLDQLFTVRKPQQLGEAFRRLRAIGILHKVLRHVSGFLPIDFQTLGRYSYRRMPSHGVRIRRLPIIAGNQRIYVHGGVHLSSQLATPVIRPALLQAAAAARGTVPMPGMPFSTVQIGTQKLLKIDVSPILFP